jgi:hypothetical protein
MQAVGCLIIINIVAGCSDSYMKHLNTFCKRDIEILNDTLRDNNKTTGHIWLINYPHLLEDKTKPQNGQL